MKRKIRNTLQRIRILRRKKPALFLSLALCLFVLGGAGVWAGTTIMMTLSPAELTEDLALHFSFDGAVTGGATQTGWYNAAWGYRKAITIDNANVSGTLTNFPVLVKITGDANLAARAQSDFDDVLFATSSGTKLSHEIDTFNSTNGDLTAWVKLPSLSSSSDTTFYMYYGNASASNQQNVSDVWSNGYEAVYHMNENPAGSAPQMIDSTSNSNDGTTAGSMAAGPDSDGQIANAVTFDGYDEHIDIGTDSSLAITGELTLSAWVNPEGVDGNDRVVSKLGSSSSTSAYEITFESDSWVRFRIRSGTSDDYADSTAHTIPKDGSWVHYTGVFDPSTYLRLYIDGSLETEVTSAVPSSINSASSTPTYIAARSTSGTGSNTRFAGQIDEVRISSVIRSPDWVETEYNNQVSPSTFISVEGEETSQSRIITDESSNAHEGTIEGAVLTNGRIGQALRFDGTDDTVSVPNHSSFSGLGNFTIAAWIKFDTIPQTGTYPNIVSKNNTTSPWHEYWMHISNGGSLCAGWNNTSGNATQACSDPLSPQQWYHVAAVRSGTSLSVYVNGVDSTTWTDGAGTGSILNSDRPLYIGSNGNDTKFFDGTIDDVRVYGEALSASDIERMYHLGATTKINTTLEPAELQNGLVGHWSMDGGTLDFTTSQSKSDGSAWTEVTDAAAFGNRYYAASTVYDDKLWLFGGYQGGNNNDVWYSSDGESWTRATASAGWEDRRFHKAITFDGKMWVVGGRSTTDSDGSPIRNDVWSSTDGVSWTEVTGSADFSNRENFGFTVFDDKMWLIGGHDGHLPTEYNDVWYSSDGANWTQATSNAAWSDRYYTQALTFDGKMWLLGGRDRSGNIYDEVWYSTDGANWTLATNNPGWEPRRSHGAAVYDGKMWILGGYNETTYFDDVWYSSDGVNWTEAADPAGWSGRHSHEVQVLNNRMYVYTGRDSGGTLDDVWSSDINQLGSTSGTVQDLTANANHGTYTTGNTSATGGSISVRVNSSSDDAEESSSGAMDLTSTDIELVNDGTDQVVGLRFNNVTIPQGAAIFDATVQFHVDETGSSATSLDIYGQDIDNAPTFTTASGNISSRTYTTASVDWDNVPSWSVVSEEGPDQRTPNISSIIQEIVNRPGWSSGNSIVIIFEGTGRRTAEAYNGETASAPLLEVTYGSLGGESGLGMGKIGQGLKFDGEDDEVSIPDDDTLDLSNEMTLAMWIKPDSVVPGYRTYLDKRYGIESVNSSGVLNFFYRNAANTLYHEWRTSSGYLTAGEWTHVAVSYTFGTGSSMKYYINGQEVSGSWTSGSGNDLPLITNANLVIGNAINGNQPVAATLDDVRIYNRILPADQIDRLYHLGATTKVNKTITPADLDTDLELHLTFDGADWDPSQTSAEARDRSGNNNHGDAVSNVQLDLGRIGQGVRFSGANDGYILVPDHASLDYTSSHSVAFWFRLTGTQQPDWIDFVNKASGNYYLGIQVSNGEMYFGWASHEVRSTHTGPWTNEWFHVVGVFDDAGNTIKLYINGVEDASVTETGNPTTNSTGVTIGTWVAGSDTSQVNGVMDDVRIYSRALTPEDVSRLYQLGM